MVLAAALQKPRRHCRAESARPFRAWRSVCTRLTDCIRRSAAGRARESRANTPPIETRSPSRDACSGTGTIKSASGKGGVLSRRNVSSSRRLRLSHVLTPDRSPHGPLYNPQARAPLKCQRHIVPANRLPLLFRRVAVLTSPHFQQRIILIAKARRVPTQQRSIVTRNPLSPAAAHLCG